MCRRLWCSNTWWPSPLDWLCLVIGALIWLCAGLSARGDIILQIDTYNQQVWPESGGFTPEVGSGLAGHGNPLGWITLQQPEPWSGLGPYLEFGSYSDQVGGLTSQGLLFFGDDDGFIRTYTYGETALGTAETMLSVGHLRQSTVIPIGHHEIYVPFVWHSYADQFDGPEPDTFFAGSGWLSITQLDQTPIPGTPASFTVGELLLTSEGAFAGQRKFAAVPEPSTWLACGAGLAWFVVHRRRAKA
jgi:hypothetical protein